MAKSKKKTEAAKGGAKGTKPVVRKKKTRAEKDKNRKPRISKDTYEKLYESYAKYRSTAKAAKAAGIAHSTARRYIEQGYPDYGMPPILDQVVEAEKLAAKHKTLTLAKFRADYLKGVLEAMAISDIEFKLHRVFTQKKAIAVQKGSIFITDEKTGEILRNDDGIPVPAFPSNKFKDQVNAHDSLIRLAERALGAADETVGDNETENVLAEMTREEKLEYIQTGNLPYRLRK